MATSRAHLEPTSLSLLQRLKDNKPDAWVRMNYLYGPLIYHWCRQDGLQDHDAKDVAQDVLQSVMRGIGAFRRDRKGDSFRGWLCVITRNATNQWKRCAALRPKATGDSTVAKIATQHTKTESLEYEDEPDESCRTPPLLARCLTLVRQDFNERTWRAFELNTMKGWNATEIGVELGITPNAARKAKVRVLRRMREEYAGLVHIEG